MNSMNLKQGDLIELTVDMGMVTAGQICEVVNVSDAGVVSFQCDKGFGVVSDDEVQKYFKRYEKPVEPETYSVDGEFVDDILKGANIQIITVFNKCTIVACQLENGYVIVESAPCIDPRNYSIEVGIEECMKKIVDKVYELEAYVLSEELIVENEEYADMIEQAQDNYVEVNGTVEFEDCPCCCECPCCGCEADNCDNCDCEPNADCDWCNK